MIRGNGKIEFDMAKIEENVVIGYDIMRKLHFNHNVNKDTLEVSGEKFDQRNPIKVRIVDSEHNQLRDCDENQIIKTQLEKRIDKYSSNTNFKSLIVVGKFTIQLTNKKTLTT